LADLLADLGKALQLAQRPNFWPIL